MRTIFINPILSRSNGMFFKKEFKKQSNQFLHVTNRNWQINDFVAFKPDHIHWNSAAQPIDQWAPISKIQRLKALLPNTVLTTFFADAKKSFKHRIQLNVIVNGAFCTYANNKHTIWAGMPGDQSFWKPIENKKEYEIIFIGNNYKGLSESQGVKFTRAKTLKLVQRNYELKIVGSAWKEYGLNYDKPTKDYEATRLYYSKTIVGLNTMNDGYKYLKKCWSNRLAHMMLMGLPCFTPMMPDLDTVFKDNKEIIFYNDDNDLLNKLNFWLPRREELKEIGNLGRLKMLEVGNISKLVTKMLDVKVIV